MSNHKIFVSIASYRDPLLQFTVNNFYKKSSCPENLVFRHSLAKGLRTRKLDGFQGSERSAKDN